MNNQSSKKIVDAQLEKLGTIQKVAPPAALFAHTMSKIAAIKKLYISLAWVRAAAVAFVLVVCAELIILANYNAPSDNKISQQEELESIMPTINYTLYND